VIKFPQFSTIQNRRITRDVIKVVIAKNCLRISFSSYFFFLHPFWKVNTRKRAWRKMFIWQKWNCKNLPFTSYNIICRIKNRKNKVQLFYKQLLFEMGWDCCYCCFYIPNDKHCEEKINEKYCLNCYHENS
jgi:hypothetical protein